VALLVSASLADIAPAGTTSAAPSTTVVISRVYGGGGNSDAPYTHDYVELYNRSSSPVSLNGWSIQYASATGTGNFGANAGQLTELPTVMLHPGKYFLVQQASQATVGSPLPTPDVVDATPINMSGTGGKVALVNIPTSLGCNGGSTPCPPAPLAQIVDLVGYDGANFFESASPAPALTNTTGALRAGNGSVDTDNNGADFAAGAPCPRNTASSTCPIPLSVTGAATPSSVAQGGSVLLKATVTPGANPASTSLAVKGDLPAIGGSATQAFADDGGNIFSFQATVAAATSTGSKNLPITVTDTQGRTGNGTIALTVTGAVPQPGPLKIHDIQDAAHSSPHVGEAVTNVPGIVTTRASNGFYFQDPSPDGDPATSEGLFVFTNTSPTATVGDAVLVSGQVTEFRPGGSTGTANLTTTEITGPTVTVLSSGNALPAPTVIGNGGRSIPTSIISDDAAGGDVENDGTIFDPASDGIDFYESLEGMRVPVNDAVAVGPTNSLGEIPVLADNGQKASVRTARKGVVIRSTDFNPERIILDDALLANPSKANVGDTFSAAVVGVMDYGFGNFKLLATGSSLTTGSWPSVTSSRLSRETTQLEPVTDKLTVATFNVENLRPSDPQTKFNNVASRIVTNLKAPDIVTIEEVQDNSGATDDGVVDADQTLRKLVDAIAAADGPGALRSAHAMRPSLVILDLALPLLDGHEVGLQLRAAYGDALPILVVAATDRTEEMVGDITPYGFLSKPFDVEGLLILVRRCLGPAASL
jgi:predicted extracellular nuclease